MTPEFEPPYHAEKSDGHWYVVNFKGDHEAACDCRLQAEELASDMNLLRPSNARIRAMLSQITRGAVNTKPFDPPSDEVFILTQE